MLWGCVAAGATGNIVFQRLMFEDRSKDVAERLGIPSRVPSISQNQP